MNKLIIFFILLVCSCTKDKTTNNIQVASSEIDKKSNFSNQLANQLKVDKYVKDQKIQDIYSSVIKSIRPNMSNDSLKKTLEKIHYWDQVYRDSLMEGTTWISDEIKRDKYIKKLIPLDEMNQRIVLYLLNNIGGWPDTRDMGDEASMAIWLVIHHSNDKEFSQQVLPYLNKAYYSDSVINNNTYASSFDNLNFILNGHSKYGTFPFKKEDYSYSVINKINLERIRIGLAKL